MNIKYKILSVDPQEHTMVVRFYTDILTEEKLATIKNADGSPAEVDENGHILRCRTDTNLAIWQVPAPTGQELDNYIISCAPVAWFQLQEKILNPNVDTTMSEIVAKVGQEVSVDIATEPTVVPETPTEPQPE